MTIFRDELQPLVPLVRDTHFSPDGMDIFRLGKTCEGQQPDRTGKTVIPVIHAGKVPVGIGIPFPPVQVLLFQLFHDVPLLVSAFIP